jgi:hypothetical protein
VEEFTAELAEVRREHREEKPKMDEKSECGTGG